MSSPVSSRDFGVSVLGGPSVQRRKGISYEAYQGRMTLGSQAAAWCAKYGFGLTSRYEVSKFGDAATSLLARTWRAKLQYYFDIYSVQRDVDYLYTEDDISGFKAPPGFEDLFVSLQGSARTRARGLHDLDPLPLSLKLNSVVGQAVLKIRRSTK